MVCRIAATYGGWPHEVAAFPNHYYKALMAEYIAANKAAKPPKDEDLIEFNAESFMGEAT